MGKYLDEYVGQENFKERVKIAIDSSIIKKLLSHTHLWLDRLGLVKVDWLK